MCGINGFVTNKTNNSLTKEDLKNMNNKIVHRGPNSEGLFFDNSSDYIISMGMRRLSIIDLEYGSQPIFSDDSSKVIVYNGEIYNFKILKDELLQLGCNFKTKTDTEVILKLYEKKGVDGFSKLDGMFAFSLFDKTLNKLFIVRDYFGEKPLYYTINNESIIWASELKSIISILDKKPTINNDALILFLQLTYIPSPYTIYNNIFKLEQNHYIEFDCLNKTFQIHEIEYKNKIYSNISKHEAISITEKLVRESVLSRSLSDVPLGTFLSGGVDSSIISLCLAQQSNKKIDTFSIGFENKNFDETEKSRIISKLINSNHHEFIISENDFRDNLDEILLNFDEPFADSSALPSYLVAKKTKKFVSVALTGDGGDEVFGGYNKYYIGNLNKKYIKYIPLSLHTKLITYVEKLLKYKEDNRGFRFKFKRLIHSINYEDDFYYKIISLGFQENELIDILKFKNINFTNPLTFYKSQFDINKNSLNYFRNIDKVLSLEGDMLVKVDRTSMLSSLECRAPFLNKDLWNFTNQIPDSLLINGWKKKYILKESFQKYFPNNFLNKSKKGFAVPVGDWLRSDLRLELLSFIEESFIEKQNIFEFDIVSKLVLNHINSKVDNTFRVWTFYCFQKWYKNIYEA